MIVVDPMTGGKQATIKAHTGAVCAVAFALHGKIMASGGEDKTVILWDTATWKMARTLPPQGHPILSLAFAPDGDALAIGTGGPGGGAGALALVDPVRLVSLQDFDAIEKTVWSIAFSPAGNLLAIASQGPDGDAMSIWDPASGMRLRIYARGLDVRAVAFARRPDAGGGHEQRHGHRVRFGRSSAGQRWAATRARSSAWPFLPTV